MGPQLIGPSGQTVPNQFVPHGQMVSKSLVPMDKWSRTNLVPLDKWFLEYSVCPRGQALRIQKYGDRIDWRQSVRGVQILGDHFSRGTKLVEDLQGHQFYGDGLSRGTGRLELEVRGSNGFRTKYISACFLSFFPWQYLQSEQPCSAIHTSFFD